MAATLPFLGKCGPSVPTSAVEYGTGQGIARNTGELALRNIVAVSGRDGHGTLLTTILNEGTSDDALTGVTMVGGQVELTPKPLPLASREAANLGVATTLGRTPATATLRGEPVRAGFVVDVTFTFTRAAPITVPVLVVEHERAYADVPIPGSSPT
ncbi:hypothetical protein [Tenggerimyces flavus]|uniref:Copper chaperone PCu(A)C n=1 Tax=Tenggerimyces flavus TaxID=1708749 RepID=A0ABV7YNJ2_9ACTN|nr:hypothetical protein [Tenggerimyces flavus]MBM7790231.1 hypothetical protein [Tenggerimyces flavus]